jgi:hypothetical protein
MVTVHTTKKLRVKEVAATSQEPLTTGNADTYCISSLPDAILSSIISLLPTDNGAHMQVLTTWWHHLWRSVPLNLCDDGLHKNTDVNLDNLVSRILSAQGPVCRLSLGWRMWLIKYPDINGWLGSPRLNNLQQLKIWYGYLPIAMPPAAFRFSSSLRTPTLCAGGSIFSGGEFVQFPSEDVDRCIVKEKHSRHQVGDSRVTPSPFSPR